MQHKTHKIYANRNLIGEIAVEEYACLKASVKKDKRLYVEQAANIGHVATTIIGRLVRTLPWVWFVAVTLVAMLMPKEFNAVALALQADPGSASVAFLNSVRLALILSLVMLPIEGVVAGDSFGFVDKFHERLLMCIRLKLNLPPRCDLFVDEAHALDGQQALRLVKSE